LPSGVHSTSAYFAPAIVSGSSVPLATSMTWSTASSELFTLRWNATWRPSGLGFQSPRLVEPSFDQVLGSSSTLSAPFSPCFQ
jgi:hypothetical protein